MSVGVDSTCRDRGEEGIVGATGSMSGDDGFEREEMPARSVSDCERFRYVDDARLTVIDLGELSLDFCLSVDSRVSDCSGLTRPVFEEDETIAGGSWFIDLLERKRDKKPGREGGFPGDGGISCPFVGRALSTEGLPCFLFFFPVFMFSTRVAEKTTK